MRAISRTTVVSCLCAVILLQGPGAVRAQEVEPTFVYRIRAECDDGLRFGTGFISSGYGAIVTSLHLVDKRCAVHAFADDGGRFDDLCVRQTSIGYDLAFLWSEGLQSYIDGGTGIGYDTYPDDEGTTSGPALLFGYPKGTPEMFRKDTLSLKPKASLRDVVFAPDVDKWRRCGSPSLDAEVFRIEGIASTGDSGGPIFRAGDPRVLGVVSGGRALDNVIWATSLHDAREDLRTHACPNGPTPRLQNDACGDLKYFYTEAEEERLRVLFGMPPKRDRKPATEPVAERPPWWRQPWAIALGVGLVGSVVILSQAGDDDDSGEPRDDSPVVPPPPRTLTIPIP